MLHDYLHDWIQCRTIASRTVDEHNHNRIEQIDAIRQLVDVHKYWQTGELSEPSTVALGTGHNRPAGARCVGQPHKHGDRHNVHVRDVAYICDQGAHNHCGHGQRPNEFNVFL